MADDTLLFAPDPADPKPGDLGRDWLPDHAELSPVGRAAAVAYITALVAADPIAKILGAQSQLAIAGWAWMVFRLEYDRLRPGSKRSERVDVTRALSRSL